MVQIDLAVMRPAEQGESVEVGGAAVGPVGDVVGVAVFGWDGAAGDDTAAVAYREGFALGGGGESLGPSDRQREGGAGGQQVREGPFAVGEDGGQRAAAEGESGGAAHGEMVADAPRQAARPGAA